MGSPVIRPRPDQISTLSSGIQLPLSEIQSSYLEIIAKRMSQAFHEIRVRSPKIVSSGTEAEVTALMVAHLNALIGDDPLWGGLVASVTRGAESVNFDGSHLEKRPDLSITLTDITRNFPLIVEAKILDSPAKKTVRMYCEDGIQRFISGDYAWGRREAFMIGYVRDGSSISVKLTPFLSQEMAKDGSQYSVEYLPVPFVHATADLAVSEHHRNFSYTHQVPPNNLPGPITLWHLWLALEPPEKD